MPTKTQIGEPVPLPPYAKGDTLTVTVGAHGDEEPDCIEIDSHAVYIVFDPGTTEGRAQITALQNRLTAAVAFHAYWVEENYGKLKIGDHCQGIRTVYETETRCPHPVYGAPHPATGKRATWQCVRPAHVDFHHVNVDGDYVVIAVRHATDHVIPGGAP